MIQNTATPKKEAAVQKTYHVTRVKLSKKEKQALFWLLKKPRITFELERLIECRYAPDVIQRIRRKGISITTERIEWRKKDGTFKDVGRYSIDPESRALARRSLEGFEGSKSKGVR